MQESKKIIEALIFASSSPLSLNRISKIIDDDVSGIKNKIKELNKTYQQNGRTFRIRYVADGYHFYTMPDYAEYISELYRDDTKPKLSKAALEVLSIVAINQPVTFPVIKAIRGVSSRSSLNLLLERGLIKIRGREDSPGKPFLYGTTQKFLELFGLKSEEEIPSEEEIKSLFKEKEDE